MNGHSGRACMGCQMADPPPEMTCHLGRDHRVGIAAGCPGCGRLMAACALRRTHRNAGFGIRRPCWSMAGAVARVEKARRRARTRTRP